MYVRTNKNMAGMFFSDGNPVPEDVIEILKTKETIDLTHYYFILYGTFLAPPAAAAAAEEEDLYALHAHKVIQLLQKYNSTYKCRCRRLHPSLLLSRHQYFQDTKPTQSNSKHKRICALQLSLDFIEQDIGNTLDVDGQDEEKQKTNCLIIYASHNPPSYRLLLNKFSDSEHKFVFRPTSIFLEVHVLSSSTTSHYQGYVLIDMTESDIVQRGKTQCDAIIVERDHIKTPITISVSWEE